MIVVSFSADHAATIKAKNADEIEQRIERLMPGFS